ncbi:GspH/FimT family pseudopilin [Comamonas composti]|uniref:GspH/FimT family pseudopilin n=1 Tax=Comamonas composti TaxID=408558 RepID=UPI00316AC3F3
MHVPPPSTLPAPESAARGFTSIELLVTIAILAVLAGLAAPSFTPLIERWRVRQAVEELQSTFYFARSEAVKRGAATITSGNCDAQDGGTNWSNGWMVCSTTTILQQSTAPSNVTISTATKAEPIIIDRWGQFPSDFAFRFHPSGKDSSHASAATLCVSKSGRIRRLDSGSDSC